MIGVIWMIVNLHFNWLPENVNIVVHFATGALYVTVRLYRSDGKITVCFFTRLFGALWITIHIIHHHYHWA